MASEEPIFHFGAVRMRVVGSGNLLCTLYSLDDIYSQALTPIAMSATTSIQPTLLANFNQQRATLELKTTEIDEYFAIHRILIFVKPVAASYPQ